MINFSAHFYTPLNSELTVERKTLLEQRLHDLYQGPRLNYEATQDFEGCKQQLITLLTHIHQLNPENLGLFAQYRDNVAELKLDSGQNNINVTLNSIKTNIEEALLDIEANHQKLDRSSLRHLTVNACYSGASSNIEAALGFFRPHSLSFLISITKRTVLTNLAAEYLAEVLEYRLPGSEIHDVNSLYNYIAEDYGLPREVDHLATPFKEDMYAGFWSYARKKFSVSIFISSFIQLITLPPETVIDNEENNEKLKEFFLSLGMADICAEDYLRLYDMVEKEDEFTVSLHPKNNFSLWLSCLIALHLERTGYLEKAYFKINENLYFNNGSCVVAVNDDGIFQELDEQQIDKILASGNCETPIQYVLANQLSCAGLLLKVRNSFVDLYYRRYCLKILLERPQLIPGIVHEAYDYYQANLELFPNIGPECFFANNHPLSLEKLGTLIDSISLPVKKNILKKAIISGNDGHFQLVGTGAVFQTEGHLLLLIIRYGRLLMMERLCCLNIRVPKTVAIAHFAIAHGQVDALDILQRMGADLNVVNNANETIAMVAAKEGKSEVLIKLKELGVDLNQQDESKSTLVDRAVYNRQIATAVKLIELGVRGQGCFTLFDDAVQRNDNQLINKLHELRVTSFIVDKFTLAHFAVLFRNIKTLEKLKELGANFSVAIPLAPAHIAAKNGFASMLELLSKFNVDLNQRVNNRQGSSLVHLVVEGGHSILELLKKLGVNLDTTDNMGRPAVFSAITHNKKEMFHELVRLGAQVNLKDLKMDTLAHVAARQKVGIAMEWLDLLLKLDVPFDEENNKGQKPVDLLRSAKTKALWTQKIAEYAQKRVEPPELPENGPILGQRRAEPNPNGLFSRRKSKKSEEDSSLHSSLTI